MIIEVWYISKVYYHVVTDKPMELGQELIFDDNHHSGVYNRVYALKDKVEEIYRSPKAYENIELVNKGVTPKERK